MNDYYDLDGTKILICINVKKYPPDPDTGRSRDRYGSEKDEKAIIETFKERIYRQLLSLCNFFLLVFIYKLIFLDRHYQNFHWKLESEIPMVVGSKTAQVQ